MGAVSIDVSTLIMQDFQNFSGFNIVSVGVALTAQNDL